MQNHFVACRKMWTSARCLLRPCQASLAPNHPYLPQPLVETSRSGEVMIPRHPKQRLRKCPPISSLFRQSRANAYQQREWLSIWKSVCWIHVGGNRETACCRKRKNRNKYLLKVKLWRNDWEIHSSRLKLQEHINVQTNEVFHGEKKILCAVKASRHVEGRHVLLDK